MGACFPLPLKSLHCRAILIRRRAGGEEHEGTSDKDNYRKRENVVGEINVKGKEGEGGVGEGAYLVFMYI